MAQEIMKPTLEERVRFGNSFHHGLMDGGGIDDSYSLSSQYNINQIAGGLGAGGLLAAASNVPHNRRQFLKLLGAATLAGCSTPLVGGTKQHETTNFIFDLPDDLSKEAVDYIKEEYELGLKKLEERLRVEKDYGMKLGGKITVRVVDGTSISYLYGDRAGTIEINRGTLARGTMRSTRAPHIHELTHQVVRRAGDLYSEGLAVLMQQEIGRNPTSPNHGADLHRKIADMELKPLSRYMGIQGLSRTLPPDEVALAYLEGGSFIKYLIEKGGIKPFMEFYIVHGDYKRAFGKSLEELEEGWREKIRNTKPIYALSDALRVEHLNPSLNPSEPLDEIRKSRAELMSTVPTSGGGKLYPIWVKVKLESRAKDTIGLADYEIDNILEGKRIGGAVDYRIDTTDYARRFFLRILGRILEPNETRTVRDFPVPTSSSWPGTEFVMKYKFMVPKISNEEFYTPVRMKKI